MTHSLVRLALVAAALCAGPGILAVSAATTLTGRVIDSRTQLPLAGARVSIDAAGVETYTDRDGGYNLAGVPAGSQSVAFSYIGYNELVLTVSLVDGSDGRLDAAFGGEEDEVNLPEFTIVGSVVGTARAINQQRASDTLINIVASDDIGRFPDQNAAEALQRVPGVSLYRDQGEGRYVVVRGLNYTYTSVKVNGSSFAGADLGDRATALDVVPVDALASIEVTKVPTPDMDGEGLGGQVNIKTKSPFDSTGTAANVGVQMQYSDLTGDFSPKVDALYSTRFGDDGRYGFLISPTWQSRTFASDNFETGGSFSLEESPDDGEEYYLVEELNYRDYEIERERYGLNLALEARPDSDTALHLRAGYNRFTDTEDRHRTVFEFEDIEIDALSATGATVTSEEDDGEYARLFDRQLRMREKDQEVYTVVAGGEKRLGAWKVDGHLGFTEGREERPDEIAVTYQPTDEEVSSFSYATRGAYGISVTQISGPDVFSADSYEFDGLEVANESGTESEWEAGLNLRRDLELEAPTYVKFGALFRSKDKDSEVEVIEYEDGPDGIQSLADANIGAGDYPFFRVPRISPAAIREAFYGQRDTFDSERNFEDSEFDDWTIGEDIMAAYVMASTTVGRVNVIGGVRMERTEFDTQGRQIEFDEDGDPVGATDLSASRSYTNWLPGLYLRYNATDRLVFRASWSNSLARPAFGDVALRRNVNREDEEITVGNPDLEALESTNWDASVEFYPTSLGVLSASVFHKEVKNFSYETEVDEDPAYPDFEVTSFRNGSEGSITGLELAWQQQLTMFSGPFRNVGLLANVTFLDSDAEYPDRAGEDIPFIGQSDMVGNIGVTYEKGGFFARLALNFRSERLREDEPLGGEFAEDLWVDDFKQLDFTVRYKIGRNWEIFGEVINITDEPFRVFQKSDNGQGARLGQWEEYGFSSNLGLRWKL